MAQLGQAAREHEQRLSDWIRDTCNAAAPAAAAPAAAAPAAGRPRSKK
ncbi:MAG TPA: hypothetical protein VHP64_05630 [Candidatus Limnocylindria bacterium]|nr:hypothetical protein [Candidatus Limnocylindria bacterium]